MLSHEDNERLVRVGKGTPLGELFRLYWIPVSAVGRSDPGRTAGGSRLLGEDLVAFGIPRGAWASSTRPARIGARR